MRLSNIRNVLNKKNEIMTLNDQLTPILGVPESNGIWLIFGNEKMGKTTLALLLADMLSKKQKTVYVTGEQGFDLDFQNVLKRLSLGDNRNLYFSEYVPITELDKSLKKKRSPDIVIIDNITIYVEELAYGRLRRLIADNPENLFIFLAHEDNGEPYTATAKMAKRLAKRIFHVEGNLATVTGRCPGGSIVIDAEKAQLYHGSAAINNE